jgi:hypothetical protein
MAFLAGPSIQEGNGSSAAKTEAAHKTRNAAMSNVPKWRRAVMSCSFEKGGLGQRTAGAPLKGRETTRSV